MGESCLVAKPDPDRVPWGWLAPAALCAVGAIVAPKPISSWLIGLALVFFVVGVIKAFR